MSAVRELYEKMSLRKSPSYAGISRRMWYHKPKAKEIGLDPETVQVVQRIGGKRPTYGTRRMAAQVCQAVRDICPPTLDLMYMDASVILLAGSHTTRCHKENTS